MSTGPITVTGATAQNGIEAFSAEVGNIAVTTAANVTTSNGGGIQTTSVGVGTTTINVLAGITQGGTSGVSAASNSGAIRDQQLGDDPKPVGPARQPGGRDRPVQRATPL